METIFDYIEPLEKILTILNHYDFNIDDVKYIPAYREFLRMRSEGMTYYASLDEIRDRFGWKVGTMRKKVEMFSKRLKR